MHLFLAAFTLLFLFCGIYQVAEGIKYEKQEYENWINRATVPTGSDHFKRASFFLFSFLVLLTITLDIWLSY